MRLVHVYVSCIYIYTLCANVYVYMYRERLFYNMIVILSHICVWRDTLVLHDWYVYVYRVYIYT